MVTVWVTAVEAFLMHPGRLHDEFRVRKVLVFTIVLPAECLGEGLLFVPFVANNDTHIYKDKG